MTITMATVKAGIKTGASKVGNAMLNGGTTALTMVLATYAVSLIEEKRQEHKEQKRKDKKKAETNRMDELRAELARMEKEATAN